jgi:hypothetical protein
MNRRRFCSVSAGGACSLALSLPVAGGVTWSLAAPSRLVTLQGSPTTSGDVQTFVLVAGTGSGQVQATPSTGGAMFTLNINVV